MQYWSILSVNIKFCLRYISFSKITSPPKHLSQNQTEKKETKSNDIIQFDDSFTSSYKQMRHIRDTYFLICLLTDHYRGSAYSLMWIKYTFLARVFCDGSV